MKYISVAEAALAWDVAERTVRNYCAEGKVPGAKLIGKTWHIPRNANKPLRISKAHADRNLLSVLQDEQADKSSNGIYHKTQIDLAYNSNHIEGSKLTHEQTRYIFETNTIGIAKSAVNVDDIVETVNHFKCFDMIIAKAKGKLTEHLLKELHRVLKTDTSNSRKDWFAVGDYKKYPNEIAGKTTTLPEDVPAAINSLLTSYNAINKKTLMDILNFHVRFETIHPFQDGNGRIGRLIMFKECLANNIVPFIITDSMKIYYYRGLKEWNKEKGFLTDTCLSAQDKFKIELDYLRIPYK
jgi:Fic family protein